MKETTDTRLEEIKPGALLEGLDPSGPARVVSLEWFGEQAIKVVYENTDGIDKNKSRTLLENADQLKFLDKSLK